MKILAIDSAADGCGVCLLHDGRVVVSRLEKMERGQDARLIPLIQETMAQAQWTYRELDRIGVIRGPGSFTGLRIGLAAARGMGFAARKPVVGIDRFLIYRTLFAERKGALLVVLESRRRELYTRLYTGTGQPQEPALLAPEDIAVLTQTHHEIVVVGDAEDSLRSDLDHRVFDRMTDPEVEVCARLAAQADLHEASFLPRPLYLRPPDVTVKACDS